MPNQKAERLGFAYMWLAEMASDWDVTIHPGEVTTIVVRKRDTGEAYTYTGDFYKAANAAYGGAPAGSYR